MKKIVLFLIFSFMGYEVFNIFIITTHFGKDKTSITYNHQGLSSLADSLVAQKIILDKPSFLLLAKIFKVEEKIKPGKFLVKKNSSLLTIIRMLRNNQQATAKLIINKVRTRAELSKLIGNTLSTDSATAAQFFNNNDSLILYGVDTSTLLTLFIPNTYTLYWNSPLPSLMQKMKLQSTQFWNAKNRLEKANQKGLSPKEIYTLASIVDEETNFDSDKSLIASVYQNRLKKSMLLQACPTIKFAMQDFTITRIYEKYLTNPSPYNTYKKKGLPPGPICTPSPKTIDLVLDAPNTNYLYFVAKADFSGYHHFSATYEEHSKFAKEYQQKLDAYQQQKKN